MRKIKDSVIVVTGASSGIGRATAVEIARKGGTAVLAARQKKPLDEVARECRRLGGEAYPIAADVTDEESLQDVARAAIENYGKIDAWVNNAAVTLFARFEDTPEEDFRQVIETNLFGYIHGARAVLPHFRAQGYGTLVNVSSVVGKVGQPFTSAYTTSKFAIAGFTESLRMELLDQPEIQVSLILPASIDTPMFQHAANYTGKAVKPIDPVYNAEEVASAIVKCIERPKRQVVVGGSAKTLLSLRSLLPAAAEKMMASKVPQDHFQQKRARRRSGNLYKPVSSLNRISGGWKNGNGHGLAAGAFAATAAAVAGLGAAAYLWKEQKAKPSPRRRIRKARRSGERFVSRVTRRARLWQ